MATYQELLMGEYAKQHAVNWIKINEGSGTTLADSKGTAVGTINGATWPVEGGLSFDGIDDKVIFNNAVLPLGPKSIYFKVLISDNKINLIQNFFSNFWTTAGIGSGWQLSIDETGRIYGGYVRGSGISAYAFTSSDVDYRDGQVHEILMVYDGTLNSDSIKIFVDDMNTPKATQKIVDTELAFHTNLTLGATSYEGNASYSRYAKVTFYNFKVWNKDITKLFGTLNKHLIYSNGEYKKWSAEGWTPVSSTVADFLTYGMNDLSLLDSVSISQLNEEFEVVTWSDSLTKSFSLEVKGELIPQLVYPTKDINIKDIGTIDKVSLTAIGSPKVAISFDSGATWLSYNNNAWTTVADAHDGMSVEILNALTGDAFTEARGISNTIRFSYSITAGDEVDDIQMTVTIPGYEKIAPTSDYSLSYDEDTDTIIYQINKSGTYSVNYGAITGV